MKRLWINQFVLLWAVLSVAVSCAEQPEKKAHSLLVEAQEKYDGGDLSTAQILLDSLHSTYPTFINFRRQADTLSWKMDLIITKRNYEYADSMLVIEQVMVDSVLHNFTFEQDTLYGVAGQYVAKSMVIERNIERCYLKPYIEENGDLFVMSYYVGKPIDYNQLKVSVGDLFAESNVVSSEDIHAYTHLDVQHQNTLFGPQTLNQICRFISDNKQDKIKITLIGTSEYSYYLTEYERNIFSETYQASIILHDVYEFKQQSKKNHAQHQLLLHRLHQEPLQ